MFTLYTSDICKPPSSRDRQTFTVRVIIIPNDTALPGEKDMHRSGCCSPVSGSDWHF
jgi:hypothetical protein